jgi:dTMP kinase
MARDLVRGADRNWTRNLYSPALVPDAVFYFRVSAAQLVDRNFQKNSTLDYWESGMDLGLSRDMFSSFVKFQRMLQNEFQKMHKEFGFEVINGNSRVDTIQRELRKKIGGLLGIGVAQQQQPIVPPPTVGLPSSPDSPA